MFSKLFALSTLLGLLAVLPAQATEDDPTVIKVVAGGPDVPGMIGYDPSFVVGGPYNFPS